MSALCVKVLLVEDSTSDALFMQESLADSGSGEFEFTHVQSWADAVQRLGEEHFDVVLLDLSLPDVTGRETFLRARADAPQLPIVVLTGQTNEALGLDAVRHGVQDYLIKGQTYGRHTVRAIHYAIERKQMEEKLKATETALRASEQQLREWNEELERRVAERTVTLEETVSDLEDFSHSITHDLRAPLRAIRSFAQILMEECVACSRPLARDHVQRIIAAASRMDKLIQDVLQYSRLARSELHLQPVNVEKLLHGIIESYPTFQSPQVEIETQTPLPLVLGNEAALTQCISNLLGNAIKFVAPGTRPHVRIWAEEVKAEANGQEVEDRASQPAARDTQFAPHPARPAPFPGVRLWFEDNGMGVPVDAQERIFKMFQRLDKSYDGTGVGLTVVRKAVEKMGGRVGLKSEPGQGSRFWLELKAVEGTTNIQHPTTNIQHPSGQGGGSGRD